MTDAEVSPETEVLSDAEAMPMADDFVPGPPVDIDSPQEVELKYAVADAAAVREWIESGAVEGVTLGSWSTRRDEDAYLDTDDRAIAVAGFGARLRRRGSRITLTLKSLARLSHATDDEERGSVALHRRIELEGPAGGSADPSSWPPSDARERLLAIVDGAPLRLRFILRQTRTVRELRGEADERAELSLDETTVLYRDTPIGTFSTLEIEALDGSAGLLARMAAALEATGLVMPEARSKEAIASGMLEQHADGGSAPVRDAEAGPEIVFEPRPAKVKEQPAAAPVEPDAVPPPPPPRTPGVRSEDTLGDAGRKVLRMHLLRMLASEAGTRSGEVAEDLHKMRVATRRMRAAWRVFDGAYKPGPQRRYVRELRVVAATLGFVRDLDVQLEGLAAYTATLPEAGAVAMQPLSTEWTRQRDEARDALLALLDSKAYSHFVAEYMDFTATPGAGELDIIPRTPILVRDRAAGRIWQAYETVRAHDTTLAWADVPALHALRIDGKRLRYTLEFFREVLPSSADLLVARVTEMQDHLGLLNDADVAAHTSRAFLATHAARLPSGSRQAVGLYLESREAELVRLRRLFPPIWRRVSGAPFRRTLAQTLAAL